MTVGSSWWRVRTQETRQGETSELFEMVTKQTEPELGPGNDQEQRQRKRCSGGRPRRSWWSGRCSSRAWRPSPWRTGYDDRRRRPAHAVADQPTQSPTTTGAVATATFTSVHLGYIDLTTGETSMTQIIPDNSAIDVSPDGDRIAYVAGGVVNLADLDGSNVQELDGTLGDPTGPQWSPDGSNIVYQDEGTLYVADVGSGKVRRITDLEGLETASLNYVSPTFAPAGDTVMYNMPTIEGDQERDDLWSVPVTGG
jgi:hypothetical protein